MKQKQAYREITSHGTAEKDRDAYRKISLFRAAGTIFRVVLILHMSSAAAPAPVLFPLLMLLNGFGEGGEQLLAVVFVVVVLAVVVVAFEVWRRLITDMRHLWHSFLLLNFHK